MQNNIEKTLKENVQNLIEAKIIKSEKDLEDLPLDAVEKIAHELDICPKDLIVYLTCGGDCNNCDRCK